MPIIGAGEAVENAFDGFYESRLAIELGMWEKGEVIGKYRGGKFTYYQLEKKTERPHQSLKVWHELYLKCDIMSHLGSVRVMDKVDPESSFCSRPKSRVLSIG